jgi:hypothetical protein
VANVHWLSHVETGRTPHWKAASWAGVIAGAVFLLLELIMVPLFAGASPWAPVRMIGAIALGRDVLPPPATFALGVTVAALAVHFVLAVVYAWVLAYLVFRLDTWPAVIVGALFGLLLYGVNFYGFTAAFPWFAEARNWISVVAHMAFGAVAGWSYKALAAREIGRETHAA